MRRFATVTAALGPHLRSVSTKSSRARLAVTSRRQRTATLTALLIAALVGVAVPPAAAQDDDRHRLVDHHQETDFVPQTAGVTAGAPGGFINPAVWSTGRGGELAFWWNDRSLRHNQLDNWGFATRGWLAVALNSQVIAYDGGTQRVNDWQIGLSRGSRAGTFGVAYRWATGADELLGRENAFLVGMLQRPSRHISFGATGQWSTRSSTRQGYFDLGLRPLGSDLLALFGQYVLDTKDKLDDGRWGAGVLLRPLRGVQLGAKILDDDLTDDGYRWVFDVGVTLWGFGFDAVPSAADGGLARTTFLARVRPPQRDLKLSETALFDGSPRYALLDLENRVLTYQKYRYFDEKRVPWLHLARWLDAVAADGTIDGVVLNLADFRARPSLAWELRGKLQQLQAGGKEVVVYASRVGMLQYYLASVADHLVLDPMGYVALPGLSASRTYLKNLLDKLGLGFQELRYFSHKSAAEVLSRTDMSPAEREQRLRMIEVMFATMRDAAVASRGIDGQDFQRAVDDVVIVMPEQAQNMNLIDAAGDWQSVRDWLRIERDGADFVGVHDAYRPELYPEQQWGRPARVAVVYATGVCALDSGIKGRATAEYLRTLKSDRRVEAVVLRVDSPGGDALPSELVAAAVRDLRQAGKPVIVSQGDVAASGGYWLSMDGARILTTPLTVTGSIGVIGGWIYDDGLGEKIGLTEDHVQIGRHADLFRGLSLPTIGGNLPARPLDDEELQLVEARIRTMYDDFVRRVAKGRGLSEQRVRELAEGRVWMGPDAIKYKLADRFGSLPDAVALAREQAGIPDGREVEIVEYPSPGWFEWPSFGPQLPGAAGLLAPLVGYAKRLVGGGASALPPAAPPVTEYGWDYLQAFATHQGQPQLLVGPDELPEPWRQAW